MQNNFAMELDPQRSKNHTQEHDFPHEFSGSLKIQVALTNTIIKNTEMTKWSVHLSIGLLDGEIDGQLIFFKTMIL